MKEALSLALYNNLDRKLFDNINFFLTNMLFLQATYQNTAILNATMAFILSTKKFDEPLFLS